jgi:hypothetical protein
LEVYSNAFAGLKKDALWLSTGSFQMVGVVQLRTVVIQLYWGDRPMKYYPQVQSDSTLNGPQGLEMALSSTLPQVVPMEEHEHAEMLVVVAGRKMLDLHFLSAAFPLVVLLIEPHLDAAPAVK